MNMQQINIKVNENLTPEKSVLRQGTTSRVISATTDHAQNALLLFVFEVLTTVP